MIAMTVHFLFVGAWFFLISECFEFSPIGFFTEARAASEAGFTTAISVRPGNAVLTEKEKSSLRTISTFDELLFDIEESSSKKKAKTDS